MDLKNIKPEIRYLRNMKEVIYDREWFEKTPKNMELYYMYRGVERKDKLRYDITIIPSKMLGKEFVKTKGHNHPVEEKYIVLEGEVIFLIQKTNKDIVENVYAVKSKKGDEITIPANLIHVAINPSNQELKLGNWMPEDCKNEYSLIEKMAGAGYFYVKDPSTSLGVNWVKNKNYKNVPELRFEKLN